jgi:hypothetical protein
MNAENGAGFWAWAVPMNQVRRKEVNISRIGGIGLLTVLNMSVELRVCHVSVVAQQ